MFLKILEVEVQYETSLRELFFDLVIDQFIFKTYKNIVNVIFQSCLAHNRHSRCTQNGEFVF